MPCNKYANITDAKTGIKISDKVMIRTEPTNKIKANVMACEFGSIRLKLSRIKRKVEKLVCEFIFLYIYYCFYYVATLAYTAYPPGFYKLQILI